MMFSTIFYFLVFFAGGIALIAYTEPVKRFTGSFDFAERWFGSGGTYTFFKLLGLAMIIGSMLYVTGTFDRIVPNFLRAPAPVETSAM